MVEMKNHTAAVHQGVHIDKTLPRPYLNSCLEDPAGHFNGLLETDSKDRRNPRSEL